MSFHARHQHLIAGQFAADVGTRFGLPGYSDRFRNSRKNTIWAWLKICVLMSRIDLCKKVNLAENGSYEVLSWHRSGNENYFGFFETWCIKPSDDCPTGPRLLRCSELSSVTRVPHFLAVSLYLWKWRQKNTNLGANSHRMCVANNDKKLPCLLTKSPLKKTVNCFIVTCAPWLKQLIYTRCSQRSFKWCWREQQRFQIWNITLITSITIKISN